MSSEAPEEDAPRPVEGDEDAEPGAGREATPASDDEAASEARPARRKRKKKRPEPASDDAAGDEPPPRREGIPAFALDFPADPALQALVAREVGDVLEGGDIEDVLVGGGALDGVHARSVAGGGSDEL